MILTMGLTIWLALFIIIWLCERLYKTKQDLKVYKNVISRYESTCKKECDIIQSQIIILRDLIRKNKFIEANHLRSNIQCKIVTLQRINTQLDYLGVPAQHNIPSTCREVNHYYINLISMLSVFDSEEEDE
jgi:hypothetical protein